IAREVSHAGTRRRGCVLALHDGEEKQPDGRGRADHGGQDHADGLDHDRPERAVRGHRPHEITPRDSHDQSTHKQSGPDLPALPASEVRGERPGDDEEQGEREEKNGHRVHDGENIQRAHPTPSQNLIPVRVFVSMTPGMLRILSTTTWPRTLKSSASIFAIRSYSPNNGWSSTISFTLR